MATVIDAQNIVEKKSKLPTEAFFVDTNIVIDFKDPFSRSSTSPYLERRSEKMQTILHSIRSSTKTSVYSTLSVALEYFKYIQVGTLDIFKEVRKLPNLTTEVFKKLRSEDISFRSVWELRMKDFIKVFKKTFPIFEPPKYNIPLINDFEFEKMEFGDHLLYKTVESCPSEMQCIFTNDYDLYSIPDEIYLLTTNRRIIEQATRDNKLLNPS